jgi:Family of unknown function (DUF6209)
MRAIVASMLVLSTVVGCGHEELVEEGASASAVETATLTFRADWTRSVTGALTAGGSVRVVYDAARLPQCRGEQNGYQMWSITGYYRVNGGTAQSFAVVPGSATTTTPSVITLPDATGTLEMWFQNNNRWGCNAYDSNYGANYRFTVAANPLAPGWVGDGAVVISRATCNNGLACDTDRRPLTTPWTYETWARQRAAIRTVSFDVWKAGVTDRDNPDLWRQLDVQMRYRFGSTGAFATRYVSFERRIGNNARYTVDLRGVDPLPDYPPLTACPSFALTASPDGLLVSTSFEYYFSVNGTEYRPSAGDTFRATFTNYKTPLLATCLPR